jgi:hypothetical protein
MEAWDVYQMGTGRIIILNSDFRVCPFGYIIQVLVPSGWVICHRFARMKIGSGVVAGFRRSKELKINN